MPRPLNGNVRRTPMTITWRRADGASDYFFGAIEGSKVTAQIGNSTNAGRYVWSVFHDDIGCAIFGGEEASLEGAKQQAQAWVEQWVRR
jgi:hypothetical protein